MSDSDEAYEELQGGKRASLEMKPDRTGNYVFGPLSVIMFIVFPALLTGVGYLTFEHDCDDECQASLQTLKSRRLYWVYFAAGIYDFFLIFYNIYPLDKKGAMKITSGGEDKGLGENMYIYQVLGKEEYVVLAEDGMPGRFNRAQRSLHHWVEYQGTFLFNAILAAFLAPLTVFVCLCVVCVGRVIHAAGYVSGGYVSIIRPLGFMLTLIPTRYLTYSVNVYAAIKCLQ